MPYMDETALAYYDGKLKAWIGDNATQKTVPPSLYPWTQTAKAGAVTCWPVGGTELKPTVDFMFTETPPASGTKSPDNPSTISGVSSIGLTVCQEAGVGEHEYSLSLGNTYYGGSLDLSTGILTVTWGAKSLTGTEFFVKNSTYSDATKSVFSGTFGIPQATMSINPSAQNRFCSHFTYSSSTSIGTFTTWGTGTNVFFGMDATQYPTKESFAQWLATQNSNGTPVVLGYLLNTPYTVQLSPTQILSLSQADKYIPRINTIYSNQQAVQVGYVKSPIRTEFELQQAIVGLGGNI